MMHGVAEYYGVLSPSDFRLFCKGIPRGLNTRMFPKPWLSVLMPTFNGAKFVGQALDSLVGESDTGVECIVIDGGSTDKTLEIVKKYHPLLNLRVLIRPDSPNWVWSTNRALEEAQGSYACLLHQDDFWLPGRLVAIREMIAMAPEARLLVHSVQFVDTAGRCVGRWTCPWRSLPKQVDSQSALSSLLVQNFIACPAPVFATLRARKLGGLDETLWYTADWDFWLRLAGEGTVAYLARPLAAFRVHAHSLTMTGCRDIEGFLRQMDDVVDRHAPLITCKNRRNHSVRLARFSNRVNTYLAALAGGIDDSHFELHSQAFRLGLCGLYDYVRLSRFLERSAARVRAQVI